MIFVSVGTHTQPFDRLFKKIDELIEKGEITEKVVAQIGVSEYAPESFSFAKFFRRGERDTLMKKSSLIITHAGAGSIIDAMKLGKNIIVVPRLRKFGEHVNNHQLELANALEKENGVVVVYDVEKLGDAIHMAKGFKKRRLRESELIKNLREYIKTLGEDNK